jgi:hypothetical protein
MTKMEDPEDIFRLSLEGTQPRTEEHPPRIVRAEVWPYPELTRLWVRAEISPFLALPNLEMVVTGTDGAVVCTMFMVEIRETYQSITMHLRHDPQPGAPYTLTMELTRDEEVLDSRTITFELVYRDPKESRPS